jgi:hypothetical protein
MLPLKGLGQCVLLVSEEGCLHHHSTALPLLQS